jgi:hypothetical protein
MTPEQLIQLLAAYAASGREANTNVDNTQDLIAALLSPSLGIAGGTYDPTYAVPSQFTPVYGPYLTGALNSSTPVWRQAAQTILAGTSNRSSIIAQIAAALNVSQDEYGDTPNSAGLTYSAIAEEVDKMMAEAGAARSEEAKFYDEQRKQLAENVYGKAGLPQPFAEYSIDLNMVASNPMLYAALPPSLESLWSEKVAEDYRKLTASRESEYAKALNREMQAIYEKMPKDGGGGAAGLGSGGGGGGSWGDTSKETVQKKPRWQGDSQSWIEGALPLLFRGNRSNWLSNAAEKIDTAKLQKHLEEMDARRGIAMSYEAQKKAAEKMASEKAELESRKRAQAGLDERTKMLQLADLMTAREQQRTPLGDALMQRFMGLIGG